MHGCSAALLTVKSGLKGSDVYLGHFHHGVVRPLCRLFALVVKPETGRTFDFSFMKIVAYTISLKC